MEVCQSDSRYSESLIVGHKILCLSANQPLYIGVSSLESHEKMTS